MKLQRNNFYNKNFRISLMSFILSLGILSGCTESEIVDNEEFIPVCEEPMISSCDEIEDNINDTENNNVTNDDESNMNIDKNSSLSREEHIMNLGICETDENFAFSSVYTLVFRNSLSEDKIMLVSVEDGAEENSCIIYDIFSKEKLFCFETDRDFQSDLSIEEIEYIYDANPYFLDSSNILFAVGIEMLNQVQDLGGELDVDLALEYFPLNCGGSGKLFFNRFELAGAYVDLIPENFRVTFKDLSSNVEYINEDKVYKLEY